MQSPQEQPHTPPQSNHACPPEQPRMPPPPEQPRMPPTPPPEHPHTPPVDRMWTHASENITLPQLRCGR